VVGGFAIIEAGYPRLTGDIDLLVDTSPENEQRVFEALRSLPDKAVNELDPGDIEKFTVVRVGDDILVDLMKSGCGVDYAVAIKDAAGNAASNPAFGTSWKVAAVVWFS
jgi:hypothetical protein